MNEPTITVIGNATADAELRYTPSGAAVASWTVAVTPRVKQGEQWVDGEATFYRCSAWRQLAETCAETITRGMRLIVHGRLTTRTYKTSSGEERLSVELNVEGVGPELRFATATVSKAQRSSGFTSPAHGASGTSASAPSDDPWGSVPPPSEPPVDDELPPF